MFIGNLFDLSEISELWIIILALLINANYFKLSDAINYLKKKYNNN
jgi:hypothetical protein